MSVTPAPYETGSLTPIPTAVSSYMAWRHDISEVADALIAKSEGKDFTVFEAVRWASEKDATSTLAMVRESLYLLAYQRRIVRLPDGNYRPL